MSFLNPVLGTRKYYRISLPSPPHLEFSFSLRRGKIMNVFFCRWITSPVENIEDGLGLCELAPTGVAVDELGGDDLVEGEAGLVARLQEGERLVAGLFFLYKKTSPVGFFGFLGVF